MLETEGLEMDLQVEDIQLAFKALRRQSKFDGSGLCVRIYSLLFISAPHTFVSWLARFLSRMATVGSSELTAHAFGKEQAKTRTSGVRLIVPLSCLLQIADAILATKLDEFLKTQWGTFASADIFEGARPRTQNLDIVAGLALTIEKSLDLKSNCAIAQQDVMQHYDTLQLISIYRWLREKGCSAAIAGASLRHQLLPALKVSVRGHVDYVYNRCIGA